MGDTPAKVVGDNADYARREESMGSHGVGARNCLVMWTFNPRHRNNYFPLRAHP